MLWSASFVLQRRSQTFTPKVRRRRTSTECHVLIFLLSLVLQSRTFSVVSATNGTYLLGFLSPLSDSAIPASLAKEWKSAFEVAMNVLNANRSYTLVAYVEDSECTMPAQSGVTRMLQQTGLIGAVGPACSDAVIAAARSFEAAEDPAVLVSFAATAEPLSNRKYFPTFFRTVYSDSHQANAVAASIQKLSMTNVTLLHSNDYYSINLALNINATVGGLRMVTLEPGNNISIDIDQLTAVLNSLQPTDFVILAVQPLVAQDIWKVAVQMDKTRYPWWYFGTDGATAFDPLDADPNFVSSLQGEIGLSPFGGDNSHNSQCNQFYSYWEQMGDQYPGLPALGANKSRSYVPYLFDAVTAFFEVVDGLELAGLEVNSENVYAVFNGSGEHKISFNGCTGLVEFDPSTGSRSVTAQPPVYDLVSLTLHSWELKGQIDNRTFVALQPLERPGSFPETGQTYSGSSSNKRKVSVGLIAGIVFLVIAIIILIIGGIFYCCKKRKTPVFVRIISR